MSEATKADIQAALEAHLADEDMLQPGELVTEWLLITASLPAERTPDADAIYTVIAPDHAMSHHTLGLAHWFLYDRREEDRRD